MSSLNFPPLDGSSQSASQQSAPFGSDLPADSVGLLGKIAKPIVELEEDALEFVTGNSLIQEMLSTPANPLRSALSLLMEMEPAVVHALLEHALESKKKEKGKGPIQLNRADTSTFASGMYIILCRAYIPINERIF